MLWPTVLNPRHHQTVLTNLHTQPTSSLVSPCALVAYGASAATIVPNKPSQHNWCAVTSSQNCQEAQRIQNYKNNQCIAFVMHIMRNSCKTSSVNNAFRVAC